MLGLEDEWYEDVRDPESVIETLVHNPKIRPDIFTFWQRFPEVEPRYSFYTEWEDLAVPPDSKLRSLVESSNQVAGQEPYSQDREGRC